MSKETRAELPAPTTLAWQLQAACLDEDPELFFPTLPARRSRPAMKAYADDVAEAKAVCRGCEVLQECRAFALQTRPSAGVIGGLTTRERHRVLVQQDAA